MVLGQGATSIYEIEVLLDGASEEPFNMLEKKLIAHVLLRAVRRRSNMQSIQ